MEETIPTTLVLKLVYDFLTYPHGQICKHSVALDLISVSELNRSEYSELIMAISRADDSAALKYINEMTKE